jgi:hypothetical protein
MLEVPRALMEQRITFLPNGTAKNSADFHADLARLTACSNHACRLHVQEPIKKGSRRKRGLRNIFYKLTEGEDRCARGE